MVRLKKSPYGAPMLSPAVTHPDATQARYETLLEVAESIAAHRQLSTLFADLSRCLNRLVSFDFISLTLLDPKERVLRLHILQTDQPVRGEAPRCNPVRSDSYRPRARNPPTLLRRGQRPGGARIR